MNDRQTQFVQQYLISGNATKAAKAAGYSEHTAASQGERLLKNIEIAAALRKAQDARAKRTETSADWVIQRLVENDAAARAKGDFAQCNRALELIGKHHAVFVDRVSTEPAVTNVTIIRADRSLETTNTRRACSSRL